MASMVTTVPLSSKASNRLGIAVISLDLSSSLRCASTRLLVLAQAETMCTMAFLPASRVPFSALPSMLTTSPAVSLAIARTQATKPCSNCSGSSAEKNPVAGVVRGNAARQRQIALEPAEFSVAVVLDLVPSTGPAPHGCEGHYQNLFQSVLTRPLYP